ncbi:hypothetical protein Bca52824_035658 [Brassica carinata]|uniref:Uncharacterized protein n=1 Tax=Brassica carinata TaxID=52824 RepID=A0A8X7S435_BRACI|nr:hypothetical protein Bca52824_035658 [Brassica carinata]
MKNLKEKREAERGRNERSFSAAEITTARPISPLLKVRFNLVTWQVECNPIVKIEREEVLPLQIFRFFLIDFPGKLAIFSVNSIIMNCVSTFKFGVLLPCAQSNLHISSSLASFTPRWRSYASFSSSSPIRRKTLTIVSAKSSEAEEEVSDTEDEWLKKLPEKNKPLYSHSLPCIEAWLRKLGFYQSKDDRAVWLIQKPDWHAQLSLDVTDLCIRY